MAKQKGYVVYKHTSPSGKSYIGLTNDYKRRCKEHQNIESSYCRVFKKAIMLYGWDEFTHTILCDGLTKEEAQKYESEMIIKYNSLVPNGYNLTTGGETVVHNDETRKIISEKLKAGGHRPPPKTEEQLANAKIKSLLRKELIDLLKSEFQEKYDTYYPNEMYPTRPIPDPIPSWKPTKLYHPNFIHGSKLRILTEQEIKRREIIHDIEVLERRIAKVGLTPNFSEEGLAQKNAKLEVNRIQKELDKKVNFVEKPKKEKIHKGASKFNRKGELLSEKEYLYRDAYLAKCREEYEPKPRQPPSEETLEKRRLSKIATEERKRAKLEIGYEEKRVRLQLELDTLKNELAEITESI